MTITTTTVSNTLGVILAGGSSNRMGAPDKFFLEYQGKTLLQHSIDRATQQVGTLIISGNGLLNRFAPYNLTVVTDGDYQQAGPLAGIVSAMQWAKIHSPQSQRLMTFASDTPYFPVDCTQKLQAQTQSKDLDVVVCSAGGDCHYTFALWSFSTLPYLTESIKQGQRALHTLIHSLKHEFVDFEDNKSAFFNVNTPQDWATFNQLDHIKPQ